MSNWRKLETELINIIQRTCTDTSEVCELDNGDYGLGKYSLGDFYVILNITELAKDLDVQGIGRGL